MSAPHRTKEPVPATSGDFLAEQIIKLRKLFPEVFVEGRIDFDRLRATLGAAAESGPGRFSFTWAGKDDALALLQTPSRATLIPCPEESVNFETTGNAFIEGDNLEVLKLLFKPYFGRVKLIYIDPPYNTGQDFVYPDNYADPLKTYLQTDGPGGRRGQPAHQQPRDERPLPLGVAVDDVSAAVPGAAAAARGWRPLRQHRRAGTGEPGAPSKRGVRRGEPTRDFHLGEKEKGSHLSKTIRSMTEFVVAYAQDKDFAALFGEEAYADKWQYLLNRPNPIGTRSFPAAAVECTLPEGRYEAGRYGEGELSVMLMDPVEVCEGKIVNAFRLEGRFKWSQRKIEEEKSLGTRFAIRSLGFGPNMLRHDQAEKIKRPTTLLNGESGVGTYEDANEEIKFLFGNEGVMDYPKPTSLLKYLVRAVTYWDQEGIVFDFFAGSCTTAQAVLELNREDGGNRKFIMVQLPEPTGDKDFPTIADVGKERIRRVVAKLKKDNQGKLDFKDGERLEDLGFKIFKLARPNIQRWSLDADRDPAAYAEKLSLFNDPLAAGASTENVLYEIALSRGVWPEHAVPEEGTGQRERPVRGRRARPGNAAAVHCLPGRRDPGRPHSPI